MATQARYKSRRMANTKTVNSYAAIEECFQYPFDNPDPEPTNVWIIQNATPAEGMNAIQKIEFKHVVQNYLTGSPIANAMASNYDEFRIRKVNIRLTSKIINPVNNSRSDLWVYWVPNHYNFDEDEKKGDVFDDVTSLMEGTRVQHVGVAPGKSVSISFVPQVIARNQTVLINDTSIDQNGDIPFPWMPCNANNLSQTYIRSPIFYARKQAPSLLTSQNAYHVVLTAIIEFRNVSDDN